jgi:hypothetical protein
LAGGLRGVGSGSVNRFGSLTPISVIVSTGIGASTGGGGVSGGGSALLEQLATSSNSAGRDNIPAI